MYEIKLYMNRQQDVVKELIIVSDLFSSKKINHLEFEEIIKQYMNDYFPIIVSNVSETKVKLNSAALLKLGKKRIFMLSKCLEKEKIARLCNTKSGEFELLSEHEIVI